MSKLANILQEQRAAKVAQRAALNPHEGDQYSPRIEAMRDGLDAEVRVIDKQISELDAEDRTKVTAEQRHTAALKLQASTLQIVGGEFGTGFNVRQTTGGVALKVQDRQQPEVYTRDGEHSYFGDLFNAHNRQDRDAWDRLERNQHVQSRALSTTAAAGGTFAPPLWLVDDFVALARPGRVTADLVSKYELPAGVASINLPKVATGTAVGITQTQNTAITQTDMATTSVSSNITTITGGQTLSLELLHSAGPAMDHVVLEDLALAYAQQLELQVLSGSNANGQLRGIDQAGGTTVTYTTSAPAVVSSTAAASFYLQVVKAINTVSGGRKLPPTAIVMHPRRWAWVATGLDTTNRPILPAGGLSENSAGVLDTVAGSGRVGTLAGIPVYTSASIATNIGASTNQDVVYVLRASDLHLWESPLQLQTFDATLAAQNSLFVRALGFAAFIPHRYPEAIATISGTGLVDPGLG